MTTNQLVKLCAKWQQRLRLSDWNVIIGFVDSFPDKSSGKSKVKMNVKESEILISRDGGEEELTLIHELLHLHFIVLDAEECKLSPAGEMLLEQSIESLATALLDLASR